MSAGVLLGVLVQLGDLRLVVAAQRGYCTVKLRATLLNTELYEINEELHHVHKPNITILLS